MRPWERSRSPKRDAVYQPECSHCLRRKAVGRTRCTNSRTERPHTGSGWIAGCTASARGRSGGAHRTALNRRARKAEAQQPEQEVEPGRLPDSGLEVEVRGGDPKPHLRNLEGPWGKPSGSISSPTLATRSPRAREANLESWARDPFPLHANREASTGNPKPHHATPKAYPATRRVRGADCEAKTNNPTVQWADSPERGALILSASRFLASFL